MKFSMLTFIFFISTNALASKKEIFCQPKDGTQLGGFHLELEKVNRLVDSHYYKINSANWGFLYSTSPAMNCQAKAFNLDRDESFRCIGYVNSDWRVEIFFNFNNFQGTAKVSNLDDNMYYPMTEGLELHCKVQ